MSSGRFMDRPRAERETEVFRKWLEKESVLEALSKALGNLKVENPKPEQPLRFIIQQLGASVPGAVTSPAMEKALKEAVDDKKKMANRIKELERKVARLEEKLAKEGSDTVTE